MDCAHRRDRESNELRRRLEARGVPLRSELDAEIILHLYRERGVGFASDLQGLFSIVIWEAASQTLHLICDKVGGFKSLYYYGDSRRFVFGSTVKAILANPEVERMIDRSVLPELLLASATRLRRAHCCATSR